MDAVLRRYYRVNPENLTDNEWCRLYAEYEHTNELEQNQQKAACEAALVEVLNQLFPNDNV